LPSTRIDLACSPQVAPLFEADPAIRKIHPLRKQSLRPGFLNTPGRGPRGLGREGYDLIVDFTALPLTALLCCQQGMPLPSVSEAVPLPGRYPRPGGGL
jgi:ADP-heptose:LPS heptosyltransferase